MIIHRYQPAYKPYYVAAFPMQSVEKSNEIRRWCVETFGQPGLRVDTHEVRWKDEVRYGEVRFDRESDLIMFILRWE